MKRKLVRNKKCVYNEKMAGIVKPKVYLISHTKSPEETVVAGVRQCYSAVGAKDLKSKTDVKTRQRLLKMVVESGHTSTTEHASFTFAIEGISRACSHQLVRHRIASFSQQSQRYVDLSKKDFRVVVPPSINGDTKLAKKYLEVIENMSTAYKELVKVGVKPEDARYLLPNACETKMVVTMNARALLNFFRLRCCTRAQWEIRQVANKMLDLVKKVAPTIFANAGPSCLTEKICWEGKLSCGMWKNRGGELRMRM